MTTHHLVAVRESTETIAARLAVRRAAEQAGFDETDSHRAGLVATELATNLLKHAAGGGELLVRRTQAQGEVEIIALDRGAGINDLAGALTDGHSTAGSPGTGLGAIRRMSDDFDITSTPGRGTAVLARLRARRCPNRQDGTFRIGVVSVARPGESVCGDGWFARQHPDGAMLLVADGLGHGIAASEASEAAIRAFEGAPVDGDTVQMMEAIHRALAHTRGAAAAIAHVRTDRGVLRFNGVGNIVGAVCHGTTTRQTVSVNGTLGHHARHFREYQYPWARGALLVMHSDGVSARWTLEGYPGLQQRDPALIAAVLYRDYSRGRDDATVLVARETP